MRDRGSALKPTEPALIPTGGKFISISPTSSLGTGSRKPPAARLTLGGRLGDRFHFPDARAASSGHNARQGFRAGDVAVSTRATWCRREPAARASRPGENRITAPSAAVSIHLRSGKRVRFLPDFTRIRVKSGPHQRCAQSPGHERTFRSGSTTSPTRHHRALAMNGVGPGAEAVRSMRRALAKTRRHPSTAARIWVSHSTPSCGPFGSWSLRSQRHAVATASARTLHVCTSSGSASG